MSALAAAAPAEAPHGLTIDLAPIAESVARTLHGEVATGEIERLLRALLAGDRFAGARVATYVPIFLHRCACEQLRSARDGAATG